MSRRVTEEGVLADLWPENTPEKIDSAFKSVFYCSSHKQIDPYFFISNNIIVPVLDNFTTLIS